jgi:mRNA interferase MazF
MSPGNTILARLQQSDGQIKSRPALVLTRMPPYNDLLICGISSQIKQKVEGFDEVILVSDADFPQSGLKVTSLFALGWSRQSRGAQRLANSGRSLGIVSSD